ncbi:hypothetical protein HPB48_011402 [Haemaphysalis longicornis]|uniref:Endonuclease/exonuclease/phosphatase domain-containing protein n=1 Tax=Haemaphysalis longicornis TaxID=44386 RepID=A0A9J6G5J7_HAELO|nr:hypothetical protein HPB48_011402 [Haemaphysalis longicornis]
MKEPTKTNIIVIFVSWSARDKLLQAAKKKRLTTRDFGFGDASPVYINGHLCFEYKFCLARPSPKKKGKEVEVRMGCRIENTIQEDGKFQHSSYRHSGRLRQNSMSHPANLNGKSTQPWLASAGCETLSLLHCNAGRVNKNIDSLITLVSRLTFDCTKLAISETWLKEREFINIPNYNFHSLPRKTNSRGGGVALYLSTAITFKQLKDITEMQSEYEVLFVELGTDITIGVIYRPPGSGMPGFIKHFEDLLEHFATTNKKVIICGDFNINIADPSSTEYLNLLCSYDFQNHITCPTRVTDVSSSIIDHILSNFCPSSVEACVIAENVADHYSTYIIAPKTHPSNITHTPYQLQAQRWDYERTRTVIQEKNFNEDLDNEDLHNGVNLKYERFSANLRSSCIKSNCNSRRSLYLSTPICPWMTNNILTVIKKRDYWLNKMKQHKGNDYYKEKYRTMRNVSLSLMQKQKKSLLQ